MTLKSITDRELALAHWQIGLPLYDAVFQFAEEYALSNYREAKTEQAILGREFLMAATFFDKILAEELFAFGFEIKPEVSGCPVLIPSHCFDQRPTFKWKEDIVIASGVEYERVRVVEKIGSFPSNSVTDTPTKAKAGRRDLYYLAKPILQEFKDNNPAWPLSAEKLHEKFAEIFREKYASANIPAPAIRTLRNYLGRFRQEQAEIGNNESAS